MLKRFGMKPQPGVRLTVVSREMDSPYSGMLPGYVAGLYAPESLHFDLARLAIFAGARLIHDEAIELDLEQKQVRLASHPPARFDVLSLNVGGVPLGVSDHVIPVKPISRFIPRWEEARSRIGPRSRVAVVGGGAGGVELAMAMRSSLPPGTSITVTCTELLPGLPAGAAGLVRAALERRGVELLENFRVTSATAAALSAEDGRHLEAEHVFWVTGVTAAPFLRSSGLAVDEQGFVVVDDHLRSVSHPDVFAAGDVAALDGQPRPKSGVYAVREGPVLATNLRRSLVGRRLSRFRAQERFLVLIGTGDKRAVASRGNFAVQGRWVWWWKDFIDRRFMRRFNRLPSMPEPRLDLPRFLRSEAPDPMRCGGCGAKLGASPLLRVLSRLPAQNFSQVALGIGDDAALVKSDGDVILTVDGFRSLISDPYLFGRITAHHSLNDVLAMGGTPVSALALATVPLMAEPLMEDDLFQMLSGAVDVLNGHGVPLVGGHSAEGAELSLALTVTGRLDAGPLLTKSGLEPGDALILTKPLGTGVVLAAHMRGLLPSSELLAALASLDASNADAVRVLRGHGVHALTDVSGFGFAGHLSEMLRASNVGADVDVDAIPALPGANRLLGRGIESSLQANNLQALNDFIGPVPGDPAFALLADPQTAGGLLAGVPADRVDDCLDMLRRAGYPSATAVGQVTDPANGWQLTRGAHA